MPVSRVISRNRAIVRVVIGPGFPFPIKRPSAFYQSLLFTVEMNQVKQCLVKKPERFIDVLTDFVDSTEPARMRAEDWRELLTAT